MNQVRGEQGGNGRHHENAPPHVVPSAPAGRNAAPESVNEWLPRAGNASSGWVSAGLLEGGREDATKRVDEVLRKAA